MSVGAAALAILLGYLLGAIPMGVIASRLAGGADLREHGSGRTGSTNALRTLGLRWAVPVLVLDVAKGSAAVLLGRWLAGPGMWTEWIAATAGVAAVVGHTWSVFIGLRGGRGVATAGGGLLALEPLALAILIPVMLAVIWRWRYVSAGSLTGVVLAPLVAAALAAVGWASVAPIGYGLLIAVLVTASHRDNIARLRSGTERRLSL